MSRTKLMVKTCFAAVVALLFMGCASGNDAAPKVSAAGKHPTNWLETHWSEFAKDPDQCITCHGSTKDPALAGGVSKVSCFSCHLNGPGHPTGWGAGAQHGRLGAMAAPTTQTGFASCFKCHGNNLTVGLTAVSCLTCHNKAPHPNTPWTSTTGPTHYFADQGNVPECFKCHKDGANSSIKPATPADAGTSPGCFNNTMCHSKSI